MCEPFKFYYDMAGGVRLEETFGTHAFQNNHKHVYYNSKKKRGQITKSQKKYIKKENGSSQKKK